MNRIKELRDLQGLSQEELGKRVGTTQPQIQRLETGERKLTEDWMRRIAKGLGCRPADLLTVAIMAEFENEVVPFFPDAMQDLAKPLKARNLAYFRVKTDALTLADVPREMVILVDQSEKAINERKTGDILLLQVTGQNSKRRSVRLVRQYVAPRMLTTNRAGTNVSFGLDEQAFNVEIKGVAIPS
jgi:transcriptional regulator with XRE-family HTH domain